jgi:hypothetical protein
MAGVDSHCEARATRENTMGSTYIFIAQTKRSSLDPSKLYRHAGEDVPLIANKQLRI